MNLLQFQCCFANLGNPVPLIVVANKVDLEDSRVVSREEGEEYAKKHNFLYVESSALTGENVEESYVSLCRTILTEGKLGAKNEKE